MMINLMGHSAFGVLASRFIQALPASRGEWTGLEVPRSPFLLRMRLIAWDLGQIPCLTGGGRNDFPRECFYLALLE